MEQQADCDDPNDDPITEKALTFRKQLSWRPLVFSSVCIATLESRCIVSTRRVCIYVLLIYELVPFTLSNIVCLRI